MANYQRMQASHTFGLAAMPSEVGIEAATQSFIAGALLVNSSGKVAKAAADPTLGTVLGIAGGPATGTTNDLSRFTPALPAVIFEGTLDTSAGTYALALTDVNVKYGIALDSSTGHFYVDQSDTSNVRVLVTQLKDAVGTVSGRVYFTFLPLSTVYGQAAA